MENLHKIGVVTLSNVDAKLTNGGNYLGQPMVRGTKTAKQIAHAAEYAAKEVAHFAEGFWAGFTGE